MIDPMVPLAGRSLRFAVGMFPDMVHTRDAATCAREASAARAGADTSQHPLLCLARAAWWAAVADRRAASGIFHRDRALVGGGGDASGDQDGGAGGDGQGGGVIGGVGGSIARNATHEVRRAMARSTYCRIPPLR